MCERNSPLGSEIQEFPQMQRVCSLVIQLTAGSISADFLSWVTSKGPVSGVWAELQAHNASCIGETSWRLSPQTMQQQIHLPLAAYSQQRVLSADFQHGAVHGNAHHCQFNIL